jgi:transposase InsO family protein
MKEPIGPKKPKKRAKKQKQASHPPRGVAPKRARRRHSLKTRLRAVKLHLEEGFTIPLVVKELGIGRSTITTWLRSYRKYGEAGLRDGVVGNEAVLKGRKKLPPAVRKKITEVKRKHPFFGVRRISQFLRRTFCLSASPETVRKTLHEEKLIEKPKRKPKRNPPKPRFFERATPNQMWQSDIFTFRLLGKNAYLIAFLDDYSRYVTGLGLYRSQTAEHVLEVYRTAISEYGVPKEVLTDNGRQYTNWRGRSRFEAELQKDKVKHIKSAPHHPMTLGKTERFWKTIHEEFLCRAQFGSLEEAQERVRFWIKYYNHKRPHQGIGGLCPADRFYEIHSALRQTIEEGIQENVLEMALRGRPRDPFYMVGRMGEQSVVIRAEKGKVKMLVDGEPTDVSRELVYEIEKKGGLNDSEQDESETRRTGDGEEDGADGAQRPGEVPGGAEPVGGAQEGLGGVQGTGGDVVPAECVAGPGDGGYARGADAQDAQGGGPGSGAGEAEGQGQVAEDTAEHEEAERGGEGPPEGGDDPEGPQRPDDGDGGGQTPGSQPEDVLRVGTAGAGGDGGIAVEAPAGPSGEDSGPGEGCAAGAGGRSGEGSGAGEPELGDPGDPAGGTDPTEWCEPPGGKKRASEGAGSCSG